MDDRALSVKRFILRIILRVYSNIFNCKRLSVYLNTNP